jgi:hypothetical protein
MGSSKSYNLTQRVSLVMGRIYAHEITVIAGFMVLLGLLTGSRMMKWDTTGELLSNVPPRIIESFFMIILITGHNYADQEKREDLQKLYGRRLTLLSLVSRVGAARQPNVRSWRISRLTSPMTNDLNTRPGRGTGSDLMIRLLTHISNGMIDRIVRRNNTWH